MIKLNIAELNICYLNNQALNSVAELIFMSKPSSGGGDTPTPDIPIGYEEFLVDEGAFLVAEGAFYVKQ